MFFRQVLVVVVVRVGVYAAIVVPQYGQVLYAVSISASGPGFVAAKLGRARVDTASTSASTREINLFVMIKFPFFFKISVSEPGSVQAAEWSPYIPPSCREIHKNFFELDTLSELFGLAFSVSLRYTVPESIENSSPDFPVVSCQTLIFYGFLFLLPIVSLSLSLLELTGKSGYPLFPNPGCNFIVHDSPLIVKEIIAYYN